MKTKVLGYIRVSTEEQATDGVSLAVQREKIAAYCALYDLELVDVVVDAGVSAKSLKRDGLQQVLSRLSRGEAQGVVITKLDRLSRSVSDWQTLIDNHFGEKAGDLLFSVGDSIDTRTAAGRLVLNVLMSVAQWERETISERTKGAMTHLRKTNKTTGQVPFGMMLGSDGKSLVECPSEVETIKLMLSLRSSGLSYQAIADDLNRRGVTTKENKQWAQTQVIRVLKRASPVPGLFSFLGGACSLSSCPAPTTATSS